MLYEDHYDLHYGKSPEGRTRDTQDSRWGNGGKVREVSKECLASLAI